MALQSLFNARKSCFVASAWFPHINGSLISRQQRIFAHLFIAYVLYICILLSQFSFGDHFDTLFHDDLKSVLWIFHPKSLFFFQNLNQINS